MEILTDKIKFTIPKFPVLVNLSFPKAVITEAFKVSLDGSLLLAVGIPIWEPPASSGEPNLGSPLLAGI